MKKSITVEGSEIRLFESGERKEAFVSLTDIAQKFGEPRILIQNWMRTRGTLDFLGTWEQLHNTDFKGIEFDAFKMAAGSTTFTMSPEKWIDGTAAVGMVSRRGRYGGGTFAHRDIAIGFCYWISPAFQIYFIQEFQRLQNEQRQSLAWDIRRLLTRANYHIHADAVRQNLVPFIDWNTRREGIFFASEADVLNVAVFGQTAAEWRLLNPELAGNQRDHASYEQLIVLANLEAINAELIRDGLRQDERAEKLYDIAVSQMQILSRLPALRELPSGE